jgi:hypothetical protein
MRGPCSSSSATDANGIVADPQHVCLASRHERNTRSLINDGLSPRLASRGWCDELAARLTDAANTLSESDHANGRRINACLTLPRV